MIREDSQMADNEKVSSTSAPQHKDKTPRNNNTSSNNNMGWGLLRLLLLDLPLAIVVSVLAGSLLLQRVYHSYIVPITQSYKRGEMNADLFYDEYDNEFTYYARHCGPKDISTRSANDLLIHKDYTSTQASNVMLEHGAVAIQNVLQNDTATQLRAYLAEKHHNRDQLGYNEIFWDEISRMSLGIGTSDHPIIADAMQQVGTHPVVKRTLEGILGPDPVILEISTLTSLNGADDQGIHTDSDWFGSSLLYSRTFLHSYSMFIALQDTNKDMGATTVCPGTHFCADPDLEELCLDHGAFEVSTNGYTGEEGSLRKGDAFLFNQNVWHRGPQNVDPDGMDRFMFIMTFASAKDVAKADRRRQGLGTYYYMRFNLWGSTFSMLKDATSKLVQPFAGLRALGLVPTRGITWIHQFCQQFANGEEFYDDYELNDLHAKVLNYYNVPKFLRSASDRWEEFVPESMALWIDFVVFVNAVAITCYFVINVVIRARGGASKSGGAWVHGRPLLIVASIAILTAGISAFIDRTELAQSVTTGDIFVRPFPAVSEGTNTDTEPLARPTTLPERHDVLISTRFDAPFLASFNRFLSFHPGNRRWEAMISTLADIPSNLHKSAAQNIVHKTQQSQEAGLVSRFLLQDPDTGYWTLMSDRAAVQETQRALLGTSNPLIGALATQLKYLLSDSRFGIHRGTAMARMSEELITSQWLPLAYGEETLANGLAPNKPRNNSFVVSHSIPLVTAQVNVSERREAATGGISRRFAFPPKKTTAAPHDKIEIGDRVWAYFGEGQWYDGKLVNFLDDDETCVVFFFNSGGFEEVHIEDIRPYLQVKAGDEVEVDYHGNFEEFFPGTVTKVHPDGRCSIQYDDGELAEKINREQIILRGSRPISD